MFEFFEHLPKVKYKLTVQCSSMITSHYHGFSTYVSLFSLQVPSNKGNFDDSDSDIEDLHHVLEESRMQLKVADKSLRKKRKDPLGTGLYLNPGKYVSNIVIQVYKAG